MIFKTYKGNPLLVFLCTHLLIKVTFHLTACCFLTTGKLVKFFFFKETTLKVKNE